MTDNNPENKIVFDGTWEKKGRSVVLIAFILVFLCGGIYFSAPSLIFSIYEVIELQTGDFSSVSSSGDYIEYMTSIYEQLKYPILITTMISEFVFFLGLTVFLTKKWHTKNVVRYFQYNRLNPVCLLIAIAGAVCVLPLVELFESLVYHVFPILDKLKDINKPLFTVNSPPDLAFILTAISLTPAVCEEAIFRGYFQRTLQRKVRTPWHYIISGVFFGLFHKQTLSLPVLVLIGVYFGFVYYSANSIYPTMAAHFVYNSLIVLFLNYRNNFALFLTDDGSFTVPVTIVATALFACSIAGIYLYSKRNKTQAATQ